MELPSGRIAKIRVADFQDGMRLQSRILREAAKEGVNDDVLKKAIGAARSGNIMGLDISPSALLQAATAAATSEAVMDALWPCLKRSTIDGEKITQESFDDEELRGDFFPVAIECVKVNLLPFWRPLLSKLSGAENTES